MICVPIEEYVYPHWVEIATFITCMLLFGGLTLSMVALGIEFIFDPFWDWFDRLMKVGLGAAMVGVTLLFLLLPILVFTGTKA